MSITGFYLYRRLSHYSQLQYLIKEYFPILKAAELQNNSALPLLAFSCFGIPPSSLLWVWARGEVWNPTRVVATASSLMPWVRRVVVCKKPTAQNRCRGYALGISIHKKPTVRKALTVATNSPRLQWAEVATSWSRHGGVKPPLRALAGIRRWRIERAVRCLRGRRSSEK